MGRPRKHFPREADKTLKCKTCGKEHNVAGDTVEVQCDICMLGLKPLDVNEEVVRSTKNTVEEIVNKVNNNPINKIMGEMEDIVDAGVEKVKRGRGRPRKSNPPTEKKVSAMKKEKRMDVKGGTGKRGRKATVGSAVLNYIKEQKGDVKFSDILTVYSAEREKLGKKSTPEIEARNAYSTLYVLARDGKIREVSKKSIYAAC